MDCIVSKAPVNKYGYPVTYDDEVVCLLVHRAKTGMDMPQGFVPIHLCGNPRCIHPLHIIEGKLEHFKNLFGSMLTSLPKDKQSKGKLTPFWVKRIKQMLDSGMSQSEVARSLPEDVRVSQQTISKIVKGELWNKVATDDISLEQMEAYRDRAYKYWEQFEQ